MTIQHGRKQVILPIAVIVRFCAILNHVANMTNPPVFIFVSGQADVSAEECLKAGAKKFIGKPFDLDELVQFLFQDLS